MYSDFRAASNLVSNSWQYRSMRSISSGICKAWLNTAASKHASETVALSYKDFECAAPHDSSPILITHGLLGSKNNWNSVAKSLRKTLQRRVVTVDARNHGDSPWTAQHDYGSMSRDFLRLLDHLKVEKTIFVGHSMGGRTGVTFALRHPDRVERLIVVDMTPGEYRGGNALSFVKLLDDVTWDEAESVAQVRRNVDAQIASRVDDTSMRQFLLTNLVSDGGRVRWKCNLKALIENGENLMGHADYPETPFRGPALFVAGSDSNFVREEDMAGIRRLFPEAELTVVPDAGHWVHSDNPRRFLEVVAEFCARPEPL